MSKEKQDYIPFGQEWIIGMKKHSKDVLIDLLANAYKKNIATEEKPIKIENKSDLPKERMHCWFHDKKQGWIAGEFLNNGKDEINFILANATHYSPIIKPDLPTI